MQKYSINTLVTMMEHKTVGTPKQTY